jgi:hypothetical protein
MAGDSRDDVPTGNDNQKGLRVNPNRRIRPFQATINPDAHPPTYNCDRISAKIRKPACYGFLGAFLLTHGIKPV